MTNEQRILAAVGRGEIEIDKEGRMWRVAKRHGRGVKLGGGYHKGSTTSPCKRVRAEYANRQGYLQVASMLKGVKTVASAHRVVWTSYNDQSIPDGITINHRNGIKNDNRPCNLELATYKEQRRHALDVLRVKRHRPIGSKHPKTKITEKDVLKIREMRESGVMVKDIAKRYEMNPKAISAICRRRTWIHI